MENPRKIAVESLDKILKNRFVDDVLAADARVAELDQRDKGFIKAMLNTTIRHWGEIDHFLHQFTKRKTLELRLGVAQLKFMDLPAHAVVNEMVEISERKAFNNAVLRKCVHKDVHRNVKLNIPNWMFGAWKKAYGEEAAMQISEAAMQEPSYVDLTFKGGATKRFESAQNVTEIEGFEAGDWWVQDSSQIHAVKMLGDISGKKVLDMCAAPGGKTAQLIDAGANVTALDSSKKRIERLEENLARLNMKAEVICVDGREYKIKCHSGEGGNLKIADSASPLEDDKFDCILLDAPCTATGTIAKHPEILLQRNLEDVKELVQIQRALLDNAHKLLKDGGVLVYSTCSLQYEECEGLVKKLDKWELLEEKRVLPCAGENAIGGSYAAKLKKH
jgi:16S rRNA (cytosine967-C5)-methyltransferase